MTRRVGRRSKGRKRRIQWRWMEKNGRREEKTERRGKKRRESNERREMEGGKDGD